MSTVENKILPVVDPICGMIIDNSWAISTTKDRQTHDSCSFSCRDKFFKLPQKINELHEKIRELEAQLKRESPEPR